MTTKHTITFSPQVTPYLNIFKGIKTILNVLKLKIPNSNVKILFRYRPTVTQIEIFRLRQIHTSCILIIDVLMNLKFYQFKIFTTEPGTIF